MPVNNPIPPTASGIEPLGIALEVEELLQADLTSIHTKLDGISSELNGLEVNVDLTPIQSKLTTIEQKIDALSGVTSTFTPELEYLKFISHYWLDPDDLPDSLVNTELTSWSEANGKLGTGAFTLRKSPNNRKWVNFAPGKHIIFPERQKDFNYIDMFMIYRTRNWAWWNIVGDYYSSFWFTAINYYGSSYFYYQANNFTLQNFTAPYNSWVIEHHRFSGLMAESRVEVVYPTIVSERLSTDGAYVRSSYKCSDYLALGEPLPWHTANADYDLSKFIMFMSRDRHILRQQDIATIKNYLLTQLPD